ncbi:MAG: ATP-dependent protease ATPase subunit HslU [Phycisphaerales bacterium]|nr:ATP-dependent protease ATPase subunit HslU [Phycisphaerales bacterium]
MNDLTPRQIVAALDRYIIGQDEAKRAVAVAIRNRWRRLQLPRGLRNDVSPKNILMMGPTGVGKTEIARRLAQLVDAPFIKVEATKFTEVGYVGRDVDGIIRDLVERSIALERQRAAVNVRAHAIRAAEDRILDQLLPGVDTAEGGETDLAERRTRTREKLRQQLHAGALQERLVDVTVDERSVPVHVMSNMGLDQMGPEFEQFVERIMPPRSRRRRLPLPEALELLTQQESDRLVDQDSLQQQALRNCEEGGIVFLDEIDKICGAPLAESSGPEVSRSGVQRDLLPLVEGTSVSTRYGMVRTDHILFIAAGAFTQSRPSDLMPELQGRFPLRVELGDLTGEDYHRILTEPENALIKQQIALLGTEGVQLEFTPDALVEMAEMAGRANEMLENIGARRLYTIVEKVVEEIAFNASDAVNKHVVVDIDYVRMRLADILEDEERSQYEL